MRNFLKKNVQNIPKVPFGKELRAMLNNSSFEFNENEKRALGVSPYNNSKKNMLQQQLKKME